MIPGDTGIAATIGAKSLAERQVNVQADSVELIALRKAILNRLLPVQFIEGV